MLIRRPRWPRSMPIAAREMPSPIRLVPIVSSAMAITGSSTGHGWIVSPFLFSLIIRPQSAAGGCSPKPRKLRPATTATLNVRRSVVSTMRGLEMLGSTSLNRIRRRGRPIASAARTKSRSTTSTAAPRVTRAARGIVVSPTAMTSSQSSGPTVAARTSAKTICGSERRTSMLRMSRSSSLAARVRRSEADGDSEHDADRGREARENEHGDAPREEAAEHVAPEVVRPEPRLTRRLARRGADPRHPDPARRGRRNGPMSAMPTMSSVMPSPIFVRCCVHAVEKSSRHGRPGFASGRPLGSASRSRSWAVWPHESDVRRRGLTRIVARSASRLRTTYIAAIRSATAWTTGMSRARTESTSRSPTPW